MKKDLIVALAIILIGASSVTFGGVLKGQEDMKTLTDNVMESIGDGDIKAGIDKLKPYIAVSETEMDSVILQTKTVRDQNKERFGKTYDYEYIGFKKIGASLIRYDYIEKTNKTVFAWKFIFYKNNEGWTINTYNWGDINKELFWE